MAHRGSLRETPCERARHASRGPQFERLRTRARARIGREAAPPDGRSPMPPARPPFPMAEAPGPAFGRPGSPAAGGGAKILRDLGSDGGSRRSSAPRCAVIVPIPSCRREHRRPARPAFVIGPGPRRSGKRTCSGPGGRAEDTPRRHGFEGACPQPRRSTDTRAGVRRGGGDAHLKARGAGLDVKDGGPATRTQERGGMPPRSCARSRLNPGSRGASCCGSGGEAF